MATAGTGLSRHESKFTAASEAPLDMAELLAAMGAQAMVTARDRQSAIACYLSGAEGWRDALDLLGGAFAPDGPKSGLRSDQGE